MAKRPDAPHSQPQTPQKPSRDTATFTPYYWEAYNEIVEEE